MTECQPTKDDGRAISYAPFSKANLRESIASSAKVAHRTQRSPSTSTAVRLREPSGSYDTAHHGTTEIARSQQSPLKNMRKGLASMNNKPCRGCRNVTCTRAMCEEYRFWYCVTWDNLCEQLAEACNRNIVSLRKAGAEKHRAYMEAEAAKKEARNG